MNFIKKLFNKKNDDDKNLPLETAEGEINRFMSNKSNREDFKRRNKEAIVSLEEQLKGRRKRKKK